MNEFSQQMNDLLNERPIRLIAIIELMGRASEIRDEADLPGMERVARQSSVFDDVISSPALALLPRWGMAGIGILVRQAFNGPHRLTALSVLGAVANGITPTEADLLMCPDEVKPYLGYEIADDLAEETLKAIRGFILEAVAARETRIALFSSLSSITAMAYAGHNRWFEFYMDLLVDSHLVVNKSMLNSFASLLDALPKREEELQKFLTHHPVLLDPFVTELRAKHQLGDDFITDFVIRRVNNDYVLVEIENSTDRVFTADGNLTSAVTKAISQVRDFQTWVAKNHAYAERKLPGIHRPEGLVVVGRRRDLNALDQTRLAEENFSRRGYMRILTFDDLLAQASSVYSNLLNQPVVLKARDQKVL